MDNVQPICRQAYLVGYDVSAKIPKFVTYVLLPQNAVGCVVRTNSFSTDISIRNGATPQDYTNSNYDKGHMAPDGDLSWDPQVEHESFLMTNMSPQAGSFNRGIWNLLENTIRNWAVLSHQQYTIYVGSVYNSTDVKIGNGVIVPHAFYKIVINDQTKEIAGWYFPHVAPYPDLGNDLTQYRMGVAAIETQANVKFAFPKDGKELAVGKEWRTNHLAVIEAKRIKCGHTQ
jgi:endonuclease G